MKKIVDISGSERVANLRLRVEKEGYKTVEIKASSNLCETHMKRYDKKLLLESPRDQFTKLSTKFRLIFSFFWIIFAHKTWNQKTSTATGRPDPWECLLAVKSSGARINGSSGVVKPGDNFEVNLLIFQDFHFLGSWHFQNHEFLNPDIEREASWQTKKKTLFLLLSLWCIFTPGEAFFRRDMNFRPTNEVIQLRNQQKSRLKPLPYRILFEKCSQNFKRSTGWPPETLLHVVLKFLKKH